VLFLILFGKKTCGILRLHFARPRKRYKALLLRYCNILIILDITVPHTSHLTRGFDRSPKLNGLHIRLRLTTRLVLQQHLPASLRVPLIDEEREGGGERGHEQRSEGDADPCAP
jgi:hypothetical protein